jgi:hypothetical protein
MKQLAETHTVWAFEKFCIILYNIGNDTNMPAIIINKKNHNKEINRCKMPVLLSFSTHGISSFLLRQTMESLSDELNGKIKVGVINNGDTELIEKYNAKFLPMTVIIQNHAVTDRIIGNPGKTGFLKILQMYMIQ